MFSKIYLNCARTVMAHKVNIRYKTTSINLCVTTHKRFMNKNSTNIAIADFEEVADLPNHPEKLLIDVREPKEITECGKIPTSINIPLGCVHEILSSSVTDDIFLSKYARQKPQPCTDIIFHCKSGVRSQKAAESAIALGYKNVKNYKGSFEDWIQRNGVIIQQIE